MNFVDYYYIILLWAFKVCLWFFIWYANHQRFQARKDLKKRPNLQYVKSRIHVFDAFEEKFPEIKRQAKECLNFTGELKKGFDKNSLNARNSIFLNRLSNSQSILLIQPNLSILNGIRVYIAEVFQAEIILMDKLDEVYNILVEKLPNKNLIHKAIRFEIKRRCLQNPFDIIGCKISKKIETALENAINMRERSQMPLSFKMHYLYAFICLPLQHIKKKVSRLDRDYHSYYIAMQICLIVITIFCMGFAVTYCGLYIEAGVILFIGIANVQSIYYLRKKEHCAKYKLRSLIRSVTMGVLFDFGMHLYDYASDVEVFYNYKNPQSCTGTEVHTDGYYLPTYSIMGYVKGILATKHIDSKHLDSDTDTGFWTPSEVFAPMLFFSFSLLLALYGLMYSLKHIENKIYVDLLVNGELESTPMDNTEAQQDAEFELNAVGIERIMSRYQATINEGTSETLFQLVIQCSIYICVHYWLSLANVVHELHSTHQYHNESKSFISSNWTNQTILSSDDICGIRKGVSFDTLWKSVMMCILSLSMAQYQANAIQHEYSMNVKQKIFYFIGCVCNTVSYSTLLLMVFSRLFEVSFLAQNSLQEYYPAYLLILYCVLHYVIFRFLITKLKQIFCSCNFMEENIDVLPSKDTRSFFFGLISFKWFQLPTSQTPQLRVRGSKSVCYISYHSQNSPQLVNAFINQCSCYILAIMELPILAAIDLYLLTSDADLNKLSSLLDITPTAISTSRLYSLAYCAFLVICGWMLSYFFLYLYFRYADGYVSAATVQFEYYSSGFAEGSNLGEWVDLSGQSNNVENINVQQSRIGLGFGMMITFLKSVSNLGASNINNPHLVKLHESEMSTFEEIKNSFPYYRYVE
jgi:hypothetical protein